MDSLSLINEYGFDNLVTKILEIFNTQLNLIKRYASPERQEAYCPVTPSNGVVAGYGVDGLRDRVQVSSYDVSFYPTVPTHSILHPSFDQEIIL